MNFLAVIAKKLSDNASFYDFLNEHHYFWDRKDPNHIWVALNGYKVFDERYEDLMAAAKKAKFFHVSEKFDKHSGKTMYVFKHK